MLTAMTEEDWTIVLRVFAASRSRRGEKGGMIESFSKPCTILWFIGSLGGSNPSTRPSITVVFFV